VKNYPIYRPLQGFNKSEIAELARKIGMQEISVPRISKQGAGSRRQALATVKLKNIKHVEDKLLKVDEMIEASMKSLFYKEF
jgi:adenylyl- and sulfurtransferase ThiI